MGEKIEQTEATTAVNGRVAQSVSTGTPGVSGALLMSGYRRVNVCDRRAELYKKEKKRKRKITGCVFGCWMAGN